MVHPLPAAYDVPVLQSSVCATARRTPPRHRGSSEAG
ncbi:MAG: hypothetical protein JWN79_3508 [Gemmatimonadetes bacterium]|jgi:hypothetical protein|nr:hypothetical protein [Gemmatimonadota bacterium]